MNARCGAHADAAPFGSCGAKPVARVREFGSEPVATAREFARYRRIVFPVTPIRRSTSRWLTPLASSVAKVIR